MNGEAPQPPSSEVLKPAQPTEQHAPQPEQPKPPQPEKPDNEATSSTTAEAAKLNDVRQELQAEAAKTTLPTQNTDTASADQQRAYLYGDFQGAAPLDSSGKIVLPPEVQQEITEQATKHVKKRRFSLPSLMSGDKTATEYGNKAANFSTRTSIITLADGRRVFAIYDYPTSFVHRFLDGMMTRGAGDRMAKATKREWKQRFESKSNVPVIACENPHMVLVPYIENVNAHDAFAYNKQLQNLGEFSWVQNLTLEDKLNLGERVVDELQNIHSQRKTWGETILNNMIITKNGKIIIVDPETAYDEGTSVVEQRARDLRDTIYSIAGALHKSEGVSDYTQLVQRLLNHYPNPEVINSLKEVVSKPLSPIQKACTLFHEVFRLGLSTKEMKKVAQAITSYQVKT